MNFSLRTKTILGIALIEAVLLLMLVYIAVKFITNRVNDDLVKFANTTSNLFATTTKDAVLSYDLASLNAFVTEVLKNPDIKYARVIGHNGDVFSQGGGNKVLEKTFLSDTNVEDVEDEVFDTSAIISEGDQVYGRVEIGVGVGAIRQSLEKIQKWTSSIAIAEMLIVALFSYVLGSYLTKQLKSLRLGAKKISTGLSEGHFDDIEIKIEGKDEIAEVATAFNALVQNLKSEHVKRAAYQEELEKLNKNLEDRVACRTAMLQEKNQLLEVSNRELKEAQLQLLQAEKMASVGQLAAGVAHEINNPIGFIASNMESLSEYSATYKKITQDLSLYLHNKDVLERQEMERNLTALLEQSDISFINEDIQDLISESTEGLQRVKDIVQGLKQFSRADQDSLQPCNINDCIVTTLNMVSNELKYHCEIETDFGKLPETHVNIGKINQVLTNLLINAGQAIEDQGQIKIATKLENDLISVSVSDSGKGINEEHINKLFDPFFTTKQEGEGTGLGLSISYGIAKEHGGDIQVTSKPGQGSRFTLIIPVNVNPANADINAVKH